MLGLRLFILICWLIFWISWFIWATRSKRNTRGGNWTGFFGLRLGLLIILIFLIHADHLKSNFWSDVFGSHVLITRNITLAVIGTVLLILGLLFAVWARVNIGKNWGRPMSEKEDPELVTSGPYKYVRHPIYSGFLLAAFGTGLALGVIWLLIFIVIVIYFMFSAYKEEEFLTKQFGETYKKYKQHTKMLIPFII